MSVQTTLAQYFKIKYKCTQNINTKSQDFNLKENKTLRKKRNYVKAKENFGKGSRKKNSTVIHPSSYCDVIYEAESTCHFNEPINNTHIANASAQSTLDIDEIRISDDEEDTKVNVLSDCTIIYESTPSDKITIDKKEVIEYEEHVIKAGCIESQSKSLKRKELPYHDKNDLKKVLKIESELFTKEINQNHLTEKDLEIDNKKQHETIANKKSEISLPRNTTIKNLNLNTLNPLSKQKTKFTPRKSSIEKVVPSNTKNSSNLSFRRIVDKILTATALEYMNLVKEGAIPANNFDLKAIYTSNPFKFKYNRVDTAAPMRYEIGDVVIPAETNAAHLFMIIINVFSNPINCGYFDKDETDFVFSVLTLSIQAQMLLARVLKRKHLWHRVESLKQKYNIADNLTPICEELVSKSFFTSAIENEEFSTYFKMLQVNEVRKICHELKLKVTNNNKDKLIQSLLKVGVEKPLFPGMKSPGNKIKSLILHKLGYCISLTQKTIDTFDKILTLLTPIQDPQETLSNTYHMLVQVEIGKKSFPKFPNNRYPIFSNKRHLSEYIEAKHELTNILNAIDKKKWDTVRKIGKLAYNKWLIITDSESTSLEDSMLPSHIRHFMPGYLWLKVLSKSIDAFKKMNLMLPFAVDILRTLINQNCHMESKKGMWSAELALIEMHHNKDLEASARVVLESLQLQALTEVGIAELIQRAQKLSKRKKLTHTTLMNIQTTLKSMENRFSFIPQQITIEEAVLIKGYRNNGMGNKSKWYINNNVNSKWYSSVEDVALEFYYRNGFTNGIHCEGALPVTLFFTLFWEELYNIDVPGSFVTLYQRAPLDLFTKDFYKNRKEAIDAKLQNVRNLDPESLSSEMQNRFISYSHFESMIHMKLFKSNDVRDIVYSLGSNSVASICERLIHNYTLWKAGFPDLIVWNSNNKRCKIVEVKGPGDKLSIKQTLWLQFLHQLGLDVEVCLVKADNAHGKNRILLE